MGFACKTHKINVRITHVGCSINIINKPLLSYLLLCFSYTGLLDFFVAGYIFFLPMPKSANHWLKNDRRMLRFSALCHLIYKPLKACVWVYVLMSAYSHLYQILKNMKKASQWIWQLWKQHPRQLFSIAIGMQVQVLSTWMWKDRNLRNCWLSLCFIFQNMVSYFTKWYHFVFLFT